MFCEQKVVKDVENRGNNQEFNVARHSNNTSKKWNTHVFSISSTDNRVHKAHKTLRNKTSDFIPESKLEILCLDNAVNEIVKIIQDTARTGEKGDGVVYVYKINKLVKIRNGDTDEKALA